MRIGAFLFPEPAIPSYGDVYFDNLLHFASHHSINSKESPMNFHHPNFKLYIGVFVASILLLNCAQFEDKQTDFGTLTRDCESIRRVCDSFTKWRFAGSWGYVYC